MPSDFLKNMAARYERTTGGTGGTGSGSGNGSGNGSGGHEPSDFLKNMAAQYVRATGGTNGTARREGRRGVNEFLERLSAFSQRVSDDYAQREGVYQSAAALGEYRDKTYQDIDNFTRQSGQYRDYFTAYRDQYDEMYGAGTVDRILAALDEGDSYLGSLRSDLGSEYDYWAQFEDEAAYTDHLAQRKEYERLSGLDLDATRETLEALKSQLATAEAAKEGAEYAMRYGVQGQQGQYGPYLAEKTAAYNDLYSQVTAMQRDIQQAERIQKGNQYNALLDADDFAQYSGQGAAIESPALEEMLDGAALTYYRNNPYRLMTDDEAAIYNYLLNKNGRDAAKEYLDYLEETLNYRYGTAQGEAVRGVDNGAVRTAMTALYGLDAGLDQFGSGISQIFSSDRLPTSPTQYGSAYIREDLAETGPKIFGNSLGQMGYDALTTTGNMAPSILVSALTGVAGAPAAVASAAGAVTLGASAGGNAYNMALSEGYTKQEARNYAVLVGASEAGLQYLLGGIGALGGKLTGKTAQMAVRNIDNALLRIAAEIGINMAGEGAEEYLQTILEPVFRNLVFDEKNEIKLVSEDAAYSFLLGALTAGLMEGGHITASDIDLGKTGAAIKSAGQYETLLENALALDPSSEAYKMASGMQSGSVHANDVNIGQLLASYTEAGGNLDFMTAPAAEAEQQNAGTSADDLLAKAAEQVARGGAVTNRTAERILADPEAVSALEEAAGVTIDTTMTLSQQRAAVKSAALGLARGQSGPKTTPVTSTPTGQNAAQVAKQERPVAQQAHDIRSVQRAASALGENGAKALTAAYDGRVSADAFYGGFAVYYQAGVSGLDMGKVNSKYGAQLNEAQKYAAYSAGQNDAAASLAREQRAAQYAQVAGTDSGLVRDSRLKKANLSSKTERTLDALGKLLGVQVQFYDQVAGGRANGSYENRTISIALDAADPVRMVVNHEVVHRLKEMDRASYDELVNFITESMSEEQFEWNINDLAELYETTDRDVLTEELVADAFGRLTDMDQLAEKLVTENRTLAQKIRDIFQDILNAVKRVLNGQNKKLTANQMAAYSDLADRITAVTALFTDALERASQGQTENAVQEAAAGQAGKLGKNKNATQEGGGTRYSIKEAESGYRYVQADRQILTGDDPKQWGKQIEVFINDQIRKGEDVLFPTEDGHILALTERSAYKLSDRHKSQIGKKARGLLPDQDFALKGRIAGHIDELIQVGRFDGYSEDVAGSHENDIGEDGFNYYIAFFRDGGRDGAYYQVVFSSAINEGQETAYSIGKIRRRSPTRLGSSGNAGAQSASGKPSDHIIYESGAVSQGKTSMQSAFEKAMQKDSEKSNTKFSLKTDSQGRQLSQEQQKFFRDSKVRDRQGRLLTLYHQTENEFTVFEPRHQGAGTRDNATPFGIFMKTGSGDIGLRGQRQMELYANITNPLVAYDREGLTRQLEQISPEYADLVAEHRRLDATYQAKYEDAKQALRSFVTEWRKNNPDAGRQALYDVPEFDALFEAEDAVIEEWTAEADELSARTKEIITRALRAAGYDGVILTRDVGSFGRSTDAYIALDPEQVKNVTNKAPTSDPDIRYSLKGREQLDEYIKQHGAIPKGERPSRDIQAPERTGEGKGRKLSQTVRTILEAEATPEEAIPSIEELTARGDFSYDEYTDKAAIADAEAFVKKGWARALEEWSVDMRKGIVSKEQTAIGWALYNHAANSGDTETALYILDRIVKHQRSAAQAVQATRILKKLSPETQLYQVQRSVEDLQREINERYGKKAGVELKIDPTLAERFLAAKDDDSRAAALRDVYRDIGRQMPSRFIDKWNAWRYLSMLGNPRTHARNFFGNLFFTPVVLAKDMTATAIESVVSRVSGGKLSRSKGAIGFSRYDRSLLQAAWGDYAKIQDQTLGVGKYSDFTVANKAIEEGRRIFKTKPLEALRKANSTALDAEDVWFSKPHYAFALTQYCKANGIKADQIKTGNGLKKARAYAILEAQKATYRDANAFSQTISGLGRTASSKDTKVKKGLNLALEGILPFRRTPANILVRGMEYSPLWLVRGIKQAMFDVRKGKVTGAEAIDNISSGLTGTGLVALGVYLAAQGLVRGHGGDDEKKRQYEEMLGHQAYSLELPNGTSVTLDWLAPECLPFFVGVNLWEQSQGEPENMNLSTMLSAVSTITEPMLEMSCLQSLDGLFDAVGYATSDGLDGLPAAAASAATSYLTQALPTILGQVERTGEDTRMTTYTERNAFLTSDMQYAIGKASARIPGVDYQQIPYINAWGEVEPSGPVGTRAFSNFLNPAYTSQVEVTKTDQALLDLYEATGDAGVLPQRAKKYFTVDGQRKDLTAGEYVEYATRKGQRSYELITDLVNSKLYQSMTDEQKVEAVKAAYDLANQEAKAAISDYTVESWMKKATEAEEKYNIPRETYIYLKTKAAGISGIKDENGETIANSKGLQLMEMVYNTPGLNDEQRRAMFAYLGVGQKVIGYNRAAVEEHLAEMRKKAG